MYSTYSPHFVLIPISINNAQRRVQSRPLTMDEPGQDLAGGGEGGSQDEYCVKLWKHMAFFFLVMAVIGWAVSVEACHDAA